MGAIVPGLLAAQAIGRWGNWFNQELFGEPTKLPWGLEIDQTNRPPGYKNVAAFTPPSCTGVAVLRCCSSCCCESSGDSNESGQLAALYVASYLFRTLLVRTCERWIGDPRASAIKRVGGALAFIAKAGLVLLNRAPFDG